MFQSPPFPGFFLRAFRPDTGAGWKASSAAARGALMTCADEPPEEADGCASGAAPPLFDLRLINSVAKAET